MSKASQKSSSTSSLDQNKVIGKKKDIKFVYPKGTRTANTLV